MSARPAPRPAVPVDDLDTARPELLQHALGPRVPAGSALESEAFRDEARVFAR
ncbi:hypothetical protein AB0I49_09840 [Streptomyces sp. NPDC050617]|uniref:hypothetical protein n=1 Tax=Streptomyces sp. NPDC050617 TaxID=3154628 RepID=UPI003438C534